MPLTRIKSSALGDDAIVTRNVADDAVTSAKVAADLEFTGDYIKLPVGSTVERPGSPENGHLRYNTDFSRLEQYSGGAWQAIDTPPSIISVTYPNSQTGLDPAGGETFIITGLNFQSGATVTIAGTSASTVTVDSSTQITITTPAKSAGDYNLTVTNANGLSATLTSGISFNGVPAFTTDADLGDLVGSTAISNLTIVAAEPDSGTIAYSISTPASPNFVSINSSTGVLSGTTPASGSANTDYNFTVTATDDENQTNTRQYTITVLRKVYAYSIPQSLMFNDDDSQYLSWTPASAGNRKTWTWSGWVKRGNLGSTTGLFGSQLAASDTGQLEIAFASGNNLFVAANQTEFRRTTQLFRDTSAWYHIVVALDTTQATANDRIKIYLNGAQITDFSTNNNPTQNSDLGINGAAQHNLGARANASDKFDGYLTEVNFIDGTALTPTSFAESYNGVWVPKDYTGSYGTNGFHLPMTNDTSVEAFNTVTYVGDGTGTQDINGVGFAPDLVWIKSRDDTNGHNIIDTVRGDNARLFPHLTDAEANNSGLFSFLDDGFNPSNVGNQGADGVEYVAWCWKAGDSTVSNTEGSNASNVSVRANQTTGFSIVDFTTPGSGNCSFGHGLGAAPDFIIMKRRDVGTSNWVVGHTSIGWDRYLQLHSTSGVSGVDTDIWQNTAPTSTIVTTSATSLGGSANYIAYC